MEKTSNGLFSFSREHLHPHCGLLLKNCVSKTDGDDNSKGAFFSVLKDVFARFGIPYVLISDQGPPFHSAAFRAFVQGWHIVHDPSSPLYPRSNGQVERTIQTVKSKLTKSLSDGKDLAVVLLNYRCSPSIGSVSPAELLMGRKLRTLIPALPQSFEPMSPTQAHKKASQTDSRNSTSMETAMPRLPRLSQKTSLLG